MGRFGSDPHRLFDLVYRDTAPWDIGCAQPAMAQLLTDYPPAGPILDLGSATGDLSIHLASLGHRVIGVEFVERAVAEARAKVAQLPPDVAARVRFEVGDAMQPSALGADFGAVVDSGFLHLLDPEQSDRFVNDLSAALIPGGRYYLHAFAIEFAAANVPRAIIEAELAIRFDEPSCT